jgi:hypothetical protein
VTLGENDFSRHWQEGQSSSLEEAVIMALEKRVECPSVCVAELKEVRS